MKLGITGHQRLPERKSWIWVEEELTSLLNEHPAAEIEAYSSLAIGADQKFAMIVLARGAKLHIIVPCSGYERTFKSLEHLEQYRYLLGRASSVDVLKYPEPSEEAFMAAGKKIADTVDLLFAVWNGKEAEGTGGTDDAVKYALSQGKTIVHINPATKTVCILPTK